MAITASNHSTRTSASSSLGFPPPTVEKAATNHRAGSPGTDAMYSTRREATSTPWLGSAFATNSRRTATAPSTSPELPGRRGLRGLRTVTWSQRQLLGLPVQLVGLASHRVASASRTPPMHVGAQGRDAGSRARYADAVGRLRRRADRDRHRGSGGGSPSTHTGDVLPTGASPRRPMGTSWSCAPGLRPPGHSGSGLSQILRAKSSKTSRFVASQPTSSVTVRIEAYSWRSSDHHP